MILGYMVRRAVAGWLRGMADSQEEAIESPKAIPEPAAPLRPLVHPRVRRLAMGCEFEIYLAGTDREALVAAGEAALDEIDRLDRQLSHYRDDSDIARMNANASTQWVRLEPRLYRFVKRCIEIGQETGGAYDFTAGPLVKAWGFFRGEGRVPDDDEITACRDRVGFWRILFDDEEHLIYFSTPGIEIDLGGVGKGYALDEAASILRFHGAERAVLHGGGSTILAVGSADDAPGWPFEIKDPRDRETVIETVTLRDEALSTSGSYEQYFEADGRRYSHILDPRSGRPAEGVLSVTVAAPSAAESDALSTAFFVMGRRSTEEYCRAHPNLRVMMMLLDSHGDMEVVRIGSWPNVTALPHGQA